MKNRPAVEIAWIDSMNSSGWHTYKLSDMTCRSVGILYEQHKDRIVLAQNQSAYGYGDYMEIPRSCIKRIKKLK